MFLTQAIFELLAEKGVLTGQEVLERVKKLKSETPLHFRWVQFNESVLGPIISLTPFHFG
jgi:hypothetical protein